MPVPVDIDVLSPEVYANGDPEQNGLPLDAYDRLRQESPCHRHKLDDPQLVDEIWVVSRYEDVQSVGRNTDDFTSRTGLTSRIFMPLEVDLGGKPAMMSMDGEEHRRNRQVVSKAFTPRVVKRFEDHLRSFIRESVRKAVAERDVDFVPALAVPVPLTAICDLMGVPQADRADFLKWVNAFSVPTDPLYAPSPEEAMMAVGSIWEYALQLAELRRAEPGDDLMSRIVAARDSETLSEDELQGLVLLLSGAGTDTTRNVFSHGLHALLQHPEQMAWLRERADDIPGTAVQEIIRWATPVIHFGRTAVRDIEIAGQEIKAGERVTMLFPSANHDETVIDDPRTFNLARENNAHVSFSTGPHSCLGRHIAALEIKIFFEELLRHTSDVALAGRIGYTRDNMFRGVHTLPVTLTA